jgi:hypothetical protein
MLQFDNFKGEYVASQKGESVQPRETTHCTIVVIKSNPGVGNSEVSTTYISEIGKGKLVLYKDT